MPYVCEICKEPTRQWKRCYEHYRCDDCGTPTRDALCIYIEGVLCDVCHRARVKKRIADFNESTHCTEQIVCPHCGYKVGDSWEVSEGRQQCEDCQNEYDVERIVDVTYSTTKLTGDPAKLLCDFCGEICDDGFRACEGCDRVGCLDCVDWCAPESDPMNGAKLCEDCQLK